MGNPKYDTTLARIAGAIAAGLRLQVVMYPMTEEARRLIVGTAVDLARAIVAEVQRTEPDPPTGGAP